MIEFLDAVGASADERAYSAREAANYSILEISDERAVTREDVDEMRAWLDIQAPGTADKVTGEAGSVEGWLPNFGKCSKVQKRPEDSPRT